MCVITCFTLEKINPEFGNFNFMQKCKDKGIRDMGLLYQDAWNAINSDIKFINYMKERAPNIPWSEEQSPEFNGIIAAMKLTNKHSGSSMVITMRTVDMLINKRHSWDAFCKQVIDFDKEKQENS